MRLDHEARQIPAFGHRATRGHAGQEPRLAEPYHEVLCLGDKDNRPDVLPLERSSESRDAIRRVATFPLSRKSAQPLRIGRARLTYSHRRRRPAMFPLTRGIAELLEEMARLIRHAGSLQPPWRLLPRAKLPSCTDG